jgi:hypothetical protein
MNPSDRSDPLWVLADDHVVVEAFSALIDGELTRPELRIVESHVDACAVCRAMLSQQRRRAAQVHDAMAVERVPAASRERALAAAMAAFDSSTPATLASIGSPTSGSAADPIPPTTQVPTDGAIARVIPFRRRRGVQFFGAAAVVATVLVGSSAVVQTALQSNDSSTDLAIETTVAPAIGSDADGNNTSASNPDGEVGAETPAAAATEAAPDETAAFANPEPAAETVPSSDSLDVKPDGDGAVPDKAAVPSADSMTAKAAEKPLGDGAAPARTTPLNEPAIPSETPATSVLRQQPETAAPAPPAAPARSRDTIGASAEPASGATASASAAAPAAAPGPPPTPAVDLGELQSDSPDAALDEFLTRTAPSTGQSSVSTTRRNASAGVAAEPSSSNSPCLENASKLGTVTVRAAGAPSKAQSLVIYLVVTEKGRAAIAFETATCTIVGQRSVP